MQSQTCSPVDHKCSKYFKQHDSQLLNCHTSTNKQIYCSFKPVGTHPLVDSGRSRLSHFTPQISTCNSVRTIDRSFKNLQMPSVIKGMGTSVRVKIHKCYAKGLGFDVKCRIILQAGLQRGREVTSLEMVPKVSGCRQVPQAGAPSAVRPSGTQRFLLNTSSQ